MCVGGNSYESGASLLASYITSLGLSYCPNCCLIKRFAHIISKVSCSFSFTSDHVMQLKLRIGLRIGRSWETKRGRKMVILARRKSFGMPLDIP